MNNSDLIKETVQDLEDCRDKILERHANDITLSLRLGSVFKQLINSLNVNSGNVIDNKPAGFSPRPLTKVFGKNIKVKNEKISLPKLEVDEKKAFKERIQLIYDSFSEREIDDLMDSLQEIEIRGVAKLAGVKDFEKAAIDGAFIKSIKTAIQAKQELEKKQEEEKLKLNNPPVQENKTAITEKQELEKKSVKK